MDIATIKKWLGLFARRCTAINVIFLGGEPTLHPDLSLAVKEARRLGFKSITIDTNGYLFHGILDRITPDEVDFISFSLDGATAGTNDSIRGKGSFAACTAGIRQAVSRGFSTSMIYTVSHKNIHELAMMPDLVKHLGINRFFIQVIGIRGDSANEKHGLQVSRKSWMEVVPKVAQRIARSGITVTYPTVFLGPEEPFQCAGRVADNYFIFPNGRVYRCPICEDFPIHSLEIANDALIPRPGINEADLFNLTIAEGCVMNRLIQPGNLSYCHDGKPSYQIACCLLKEEILP
ncbi:MAG: radical SAM protein [Pseudomonadota bacterium]